MFFKKSLVFCAISMFVLAGCGTGVTFQVQKTPVMNTGGIKRIAIKPFESGTAAINKEIARYITSAAIINFQNANYFQLVDYSEVQNLQARGEKIENHIDGIFTGQVITLRTADSTFTQERKDPTTEEKIQVTMYLREVELSFNYRFTRTRDGSITNILTKQGKTSDTKETQQDLQSASQLLQSIVTKELAKLAQETAPYTTNVTRTLMDEDNKALKPLMKEILADVKNKNYMSALNQYLSMYETHGNYAAAYNASVMYESQKNLSSAINLMEGVYAKTGNPKASARLSTLKAALQEQESLVTQYAGSQRDKVIAYAVEEIVKALPNNAKIWVFNNSKEEKTLSSAMEDGITSGLLKKGIIVVDRDNEKLMAAEQKFQASGNVSDNDFVSIGKSAGANTLITIAVIGTSSQRRLQLRVLDIEKKTNRYQSDANDNWKL